MRRRIRGVLVRAFDLAIFHEAINGNPATAVPSVPVPRDKKKPVPPEDLDVARAAIREWANAEKCNGPKIVDLPDIVELRRTNEILKAAAIFFGPSSTGPGTGDQVHH